MQKRTSILTFVLIMALFIGLFSGTANAADPIDVTTDDTAIVLGKTVTQDQLASAAIAYVRKYVNTAYLYKTEDFITCTLLDISIPTQPSTLTVNGVISTTTDLRADLQQFMDVANYFKVTRSANQIERYNFKFTPYIQEVVINETSAYVKLYINLSFQYEENGEPAACGDHYEVQFANVGNSWCIVNVIAEEIEAYGLTREQFDCEKALLEFVPVSKMAISEDELQISQSTLDNSASTNAVTPGNGLVITNRAYNAENAIAYAYNYTTSSWTSSGNDSTFLNAYFYDYSSPDGNCQNFASQCVWAGLYGNNHPDFIDSHAAPMDASGTTDFSQWYGEKAYRSDPDHCWISCSKFRNYVEANSDNSLTTTLKASIYQISANTSFSSIPSATSVLPGAVLHVYGNESNFSHAIVVTGATGTAYDQITYCGNSPMRKAILLSSYSSFTDHPIKVIIPDSFQTASACTGHTYPTSSSSPLGLASTCSNCGYVRLQVTSSIPKPIRVGRSKTISGSVNYQCYRMAIGIKYLGLPSEGAYPNATSTVWTEFDGNGTNSVGSASVDYTFNQVGYYRITISARDTDPSESNSTSVSHTFTVYVYSPS